MAFEAKEQRRRRLEEIYIRRGQSASPDPGASAPEVAIPEGESRPGEQLFFVVKHLADELVVADGEVVSFKFLAVAAVSLEDFVGLLDGGDFFHGA